MICVKPASSKLCLFVLVLACSRAGSTDNVAPGSIDGRWSGVATALGAHAPLILDLKTKDGSLTASVTMNLEALYVDRPLAGVRYAHPQVHFEFYDFRGNNGVFDGIRAGDTITGVTRKNDHAVDMRFERTARLIPSPPYRRAVLQFTSRDGTRLEGTFFAPPARSPVPAVVLIHGSGSAIREDLYYLADSFARAGIGAFVYDKRRSYPTFNALADDARAAVESVKKLRVVDPERVGLCGISEGGWIAPVAAAGNPGVAFVASIVGPGVTYASNALYQNGMRIRAVGASDSAVSRYGAIASRLNSYVRRLKSAGQRMPSSLERAELQAELDNVRRETWSGVTDLPARIPASSDTARFRWRMLDFDPLRYWKRVRAPVLLVFAANDRNTNTAQSRRLIPAALAAGGNSHFSEIVYSGVEHDLMVQPRPGEAFHFPYPVAGYPDSIVVWVSRVAGGHGPAAECTAAGCRVE